MIGIVDVEDDVARRSRVAPTEEFDEVGADLLERPRIGEVPEPGDGRLARDIVSTLGRTLAGDQQRRVVAQGIEVVGILAAIIHEGVRGDMMGGDEAVGLA